MLRAFRILAALQRQNTGLTSVRFEYARPSSNGASTTIDAAGTIAATLIVAGEGGDGGGNGGGGRGDGGIAGGVGGDLVCSALSLVASPLTLIAVSPNRRERRAQARLHLQRHGAER